MPLPDPLLHQSSEACGVDIRTIRRWRQLDGFPHGKPVEEVVAWMKSLGLGEHKKGSRDLGELKAELLRVQIKRENRRYQVEGRELIPLRDSISAASLARTTWQNAIRSKLEYASASRLVGKDVSEIRAEMRTIYDELVAEINQAWDAAGIEDPPSVEG